MGRRVVVPPELARIDHVMSVRDLCKQYPIRNGLLQRVTGSVTAVDRISFDIHRGETLGLVGESGCGKTTLGRCVAGLIQPNSGGVYYALDSADRDRIDELRARGDDRTPQDNRELDTLTRKHRVDKLSKHDFGEYRRNCQMVFQDSFASLNPRHLVKDIVGRPLRIHHRAARRDVTARVVELLEEVGLGSEHLYRYPHQFSGGQRQRISIARALALEPQLVVLDEPTSALDVSVQAQILNLLHSLQQARGLAYLFISHDLNVVRHVSERVVVMYLGQIVETGPADDLFNSPRHPYTAALMDANPGVADGQGRVRLVGEIPSPADPPTGCRFHPRCPEVTAACGWGPREALGILDRAGLLAQVVDVDHDSTFSASLEFESHSQAAKAEQLLCSTATPEPLRGAASTIRATDSRLRLEYVAVEDIALTDITDNRATACIRYQNTN